MTDKFETTVFSILTYCMVAICAFAAGVFVMSWGM